MLGTLALIPTRCDGPHVTPPAPARPPKAAPAEPETADTDRARNLEAWKARFVWGVPVTRIASVFGVARQTVHRWIDQADATKEAAAIRATQGKPAR